MFTYPPPICALDSSFSSPGFPQDTSIDNVIPVDGVTLAPPPNKLWGLSNAPGPYILYNVDSSSSGPLKANDSKKIRSSISKGVVRKSARGIERKLYQKSYRNRTYSKHLPFRQLNFEATNTFRSPYTSTTTPVVTNVQTLQLLAYPNGDASELNSTTGNPGTPLVDANLDFADFGFIGIDIDELSTAFDTAESQALALPDNFDL